MIVASETRQVLSETLTLAQAIHNQYKELYKQFSDEIQAHLQSGFNTSEVAQKIGDKDLSTIQALALVNEAVFHSQRLANLWTAFYFPKFSELYIDLKNSVYTLTHAFNTDGAVVDIKTSAEKERQLQIFGYEVFTIQKDLEKYKASVESFGKYVENAVYTLDRYQKMIDSLDKMQAKSLWIDSQANTQGLNIIKDGEDLI